MLNRMNLDDRTYQEIVSDAIYHIPKEYPEWTNYNPSDPGITLIQMLSWLKEVQQFHLSQINDWKRRKYLRLLGAEIQHIRPADGSVNIEPGPEWNYNHSFIPKGTRFYAGDIPFETMEKTGVYSAKFISTYMINGGELSRYKNIGNDFEKQMKLYPFGETPQAGAQCYFILDRAFQTKTKTDIYFDIFNGYKVVRNPIKDEFIPLAKLKWEYYSTDGWEEFIVEKDETHELLQSGTIRFSMKKEMAEDKRFGVHQIRVTLLENDYDVPPLIQNIFLNEVQLRQQYTGCDFEDYEVAVSGSETRIVLETDMYLAQTGEVEVYQWDGTGWNLVKDCVIHNTEDCCTRVSVPCKKLILGRQKFRLAVWEQNLYAKRIAGVGTTFANQEYDLNMYDLVYEDFEIMVFDHYTKSYVDYHKVEDFDNCGAEDMVYILDVEKGKIIFGNCDNGMAPNGEIRILRMRKSLGKTGNIKADKIRECDSYSGLVVKQYKKTSGGHDQESIDECLERFRNEMKEVNRGVTYSDYEELVKKAPGLLVVDSRVIPPSEMMKKGGKIPDNQITIVVQPLEIGQKNGTLSEKYRKNLERILEEKKMLGTRIKVLKPEYIGISVFAEIEIKAQFQDAKDIIEKQVREYLDDTCWKIGTPVLGSTIYGIIDTLPCVWQIRSLTLDAVGKDCRRLVNGDIGLPPNGLAYLREIDLTIYTAE